MKARVSEADSAEVDLGGYIEQLSGFLPEALFQEVAGLTGSDLRARATFGVFGRVAEVEFPPIQRTDQVCG